MKQKRGASVFFIAVLLIILYFVFFPYPLGRELVARPAWALTLPGAAAGAQQAAGSAGGTSGAGNGPVFPFELGGLFGYVAPDGSLAWFDHALFGVALSRTGSINYTRLATDWLFLDPHGQRRMSFSGNGYPVLSGDGSRVLIVNPDLTGLSEVDSSGDTAWRRDFPAVITSLSLHGSYLLTGLLNGSLQLLNRQGTPVFQAAPGGSRIPVVYGCSVSPNGALIASISGIDPQVLTVYQKSGSTYTVMEKQALSTDFRREMRIEFSSDSRYLLFEDRGAAGLYDPEERRFTRLSAPGTLAAAAFLREGRVAAVASRDAGRVTLRLFSPFLSEISSESFSAADVFLGTIDGQLLLGIDGRLLRVDVEAL